MYAIFNETEAVTIISSQSTKKQTKIWRFKKSQFQIYSKQSSNPVPNILFNKIGLT